MLTAMVERRAHWERVYEAKPSESVSWFEANPARSLALIEAAGTRESDAIIDIGGGASRLVDALLTRGFRRISVLDISAKALAVCQARLGRSGDSVEWLIEDVTRWTPDRGRYRLWHDRAVFHFLTADEDRNAYLRALDRGLADGGHLILATFAPSGPGRCSGLSVRRYGAEELQDLLGSGFELRFGEVAAHLTPGGGKQDFTWCLFRKRNG